MDMRVPDLSHDDSSAGLAVDAATPSSADEESRAQEAALERLADRVTAARSIV